MLIGADRDHLAGRFKRLHPATLWLPVVDLLRGLLIPGLIAAWVLGPGVILFLGGGIVLLPAAVGWVVRYLRFTYCLAPRELIVRSGVLERNVRHIPYERIQDVRIEQGLLHRLLGYAKVQIETAASETVELTLNVVTLREAEVIRQATAPALQPGPAGAEVTGGVSGVELHRATVRDLVLGGLTSQLAAFLGVVAGALFYFEFVGTLGTPTWAMFNPVAPVERKWDEMSQHALARAPFVKPLLGFLLGDTLGKALLLGVVGLGFSTVRFVVGYHGFRLTLAGDQLRRSFGLLRRQHFATPLNRIQVLRIEEGWLRRWVGLVAVQLDTASHREVGDEEKKRPRAGVLVPVLRRTRAPRLVERVMPGLDWDALRWMPVSPRAVFRKTRRDWVLLALALGVSATVLRGYGLATLPLFPLIYVWNRRWFRHLAYAVSADHFVLRKGWWRKTTTVVSIQNIQSAACTQNPLEVRAGLASVLIEVGGSDHTGGVPRLPYLAFSVAEDLVRHLTRSAAGRPFSW